MIDIKNLSVVLDGRQILDGINFHIAGGEMVVLLGQSGSGKTVFIKTLLGLIKPSAGAITLFEKDISRLTREELLRLREKTAMVFQSAALFDSLTVWQNVGFFLLEHTELEEEEIKKIAGATLRDVGLSGILDQKPEQLSGGMRKRVGIARALVSRPGIIFYDEPTAGLDPVTASSIIELIVSLHKKFSTTDVVVTHDLNIAQKIADRVAVLDNGKIFAAGKWEEIRHLRHPLIRAAGGDDDKTTAEP